MILVDTNVLLDVVTQDRTWSDWSFAALEAASLRGPLIINDVIYAELSVRYESVEQLDALISEASLDIARAPLAALFLAGKAFASYRKAGGTKTGVLPDFFIGAHAAVAQMPLLTRDARRYRRYFPTVSLITP